MWFFFLFGEIYRNKNIVFLMKIYDLENLIFFYIWKFLGFFVEFFDIIIWEFYMLLKI